MLTGHTKSTMVNFWKGLLGLSVILTLTCVVICEHYPVVKTKSGPVKGLLSQHDKGTVYKFLKIPFAKPPVGNLRFSNPVPIDPWNDVIDATEYPPSCTQKLTGIIRKLIPTTEMSEDCLFLSVYVPNDLSSANKKAVMVWIHGGGYHLGQSSMYDGSHLALTGDVIVVTTNYRLNVFGFFSTFDSAALGNYGLWDQIMALQWVKDAESITIFGQSAGGFSVSLLSLMPRNKGLFHRVITQSGTASSPIAYNNKDKSYMKSVVEDVGCNESDSSLIMKCLRHVPAGNFLNASDKAFHDGSINDIIIPFSPRVDNVLIIDTPSNILKNPLSSSNQFMKSLDYMAGYTSAEGLSIIFNGAAMDPNGSFNATEGITTKFLCKILAQKLSEKHYNNRSDFTDAVCEIYSVENGDTTNKIEQAKKVLDVYGDFMFHISIIESLNAHTKTGKLGQTYQYVFSRPIRSSYGYEFPDWFEGAPHAAEVAYLFGLKDLSDKANIIITDEDFRLANIMMKHWTNFAKTGNPNTESLPNWPNYSSENMEFMNFNLDAKQEMASADFRLRMSFWLKDVPNISGHIPNHEEL